MQYLSTRDQALLLAPNGKPAVFMISIECKREWMEYEPHFKACCMKQTCKVH